MSSTKISIQHLRGDIIRNAIGKNGYVNERFRKTVLETLEHRGLVFDERHYYPPHVVQNLMQEAWGKEISQCISKLMDCAV